MVSTPKYIQRFIVYLPLNGISQINIMLYLKRLRAIEIIKSEIIDFKGEIHSISHFFDQRSSPPAGQLKVRRFHTPMHWLHFQTQSLRPFLNTVYEQNMRYCPHQNLAPTLPTMPAVWCGCTVAHVASSCCSRGRDEEHQLRTPRFYSIFKLTLTHCGMTWGKHINNNSLVENSIIHIQQLRWCG